MGGGGGGVRVCALTIAPAIAFLLGFLWISHAFCTIYLHEHTVEKAL